MSVIITQERQILFLKNGKKAEKQGLLSICCAGKQGNGTKIYGINHRREIYAKKNGIFGSYHKGLSG
jgi:hypothetical protein